MSAMDKRAYQREYARRRREQKHAAKLANAHRCPFKMGPAVCNGPLRIETDGGAGTVVSCDWCDRRKRGICRDCGARVAGQIGRGATRGRTRAVQRGASTLRLALRPANRPTQVHTPPPPSPPTEPVMSETPAYLCFNDWAGFRREPVFIVGETPKRWRIRADTAVRLAGRNRWLDVGETALVPKSAVQFATRTEDGPDDCQFCLGAKGGVKGNENRLGSVIVCDYCTVLVRGWKEERPGFDASGNEICCWHGGTNCAGCCVAGDCDIHKDAPLDGAV